MKKKTLVFLFLLSAFVTLLLPDCSQPEEQMRNEPNTLVLIWNKGYEKQTAQEVTRGMIWSFSWMGAELPEGSFRKAVLTTDSIRYTVNFDSLGFNATAKEALHVICDSIRNSSEYKALGGIDIGKFIMLTLGSSWHYYEITGVPKTLKEFREKYKLDSTAGLYGVTVSGIAEGHRKIYFSRDTSLFHYGFMGVEGHGSLDSATFVPELYECFDVMPNGQLRFMIYGKDGNLTAGTPDFIGEAGKPLKCLWCHETSIQPLFVVNVPVAGMMTNEEFLVMRDSMQSALQRYRFALKSDMNYEAHREHTLAELLYMTYMEPNVLHLASEWNTTEAEVKARTSGVHAELFREFDYIGTVYQRKEIDALDSLLNLEVSTSARETGSEVNYFRKR